MTIDTTYDAITHLLPRFQEIQESPDAITQDIQRIQQASQMLLQTIANGESFDTDPFVLLPQIDNEIEDLLSSYRQMLAAFNEAGASPESNSTIQSLITSIFLLEILVQARENLALALQINQQTANAATPSS